MTSTNDGKDVKSNQTSGHKSKSYYIDLYKSLEARLNGDGSLEARTTHVCEAWRRVYSLYQHSASKTHPHLLTWLQRHTAHAVLQPQWKESKTEHARLTAAIHSLVAEVEAAATGRDLHPWELQLLQRASWFLKALKDPWGHPVLNSLIESNGEPVTDQKILEWLVEENGVVLVTRLTQMARAKKCDDLALRVASAVMDRARAAIPHRPDDLADEKVEEEEDNTSFVAVLERDANFTVPIWEQLTDIELVLLHKFEERSRCIELAKLTPLQNGYAMVERLRNRLENSPREKKLWKYAKEVATLVATVIITRCMVLSKCSVVRDEALTLCTRSLARLVPPDRLPGVSNTLTTAAVTARHLHIFCVALDAQCSADMKPFICELYIRAITAGMNELEQLKLKAEKTAEGRTSSQTLASWFTQLGDLLQASARLRAECALTAFSLHPAPALFRAVADTPPPPPPPPGTAQESATETTSEFGSWANDSRTQSNLVKTSETLQLKQTEQHQANVLSTVILTDGEALGLKPELCQDLAVLLSGPRVKTLSWDMDREVLLQNCRSYMERTHGGTRAVTTELKYLNLDPSAYRHLPEEEDDETGIEKGYEHELPVETPEEIWQEAFLDTELTESADDSEVELQLKKKKSKAHLASSDDEDPLSSIAEIKKEKKKLAKEKSKEQRRKKTHKRDTSKDGSRDRRKDKNRKTKKESKKNKSEQPTTGSLTSLLGMKVTNMPSQVHDGEKRVRKKKERRRDSTMFSYVSVTDSDYDSQEKLSQVSDNDPNIVVDGVFSMDELKSPERQNNDDDQKPIDNTKPEFKIYGIAQSTVIDDIKKRPTLSAQKVTTGTTNDSDVSRSKSPYLTPNQLGNRHVISSKAKSRISKLLQFRLNKCQHRPVPKTPGPTQTQAVQKQSLVGMKVYNPEEVPRVYMNKKQCQQLEVIKNEVNQLLNERSSAANMPRVPNNETPKSDNKPLNVYNVQKHNQDYTTAMHGATQNMFSESQKRNEYVQNSPTKHVQHNYTNQSQYLSPTKTPDLVSSQSLNITPPRSIMAQQPFHKSLQNLSTENKYDVPKKPLLINDPNYYSRQHSKSNVQLSPRIISNTCIKPPIQTVTSHQQYAKCDSARNQQSSVPRAPARNVTQVTSPKSDVIKYGTKYLSCSMQDVTSLGSRNDGNKKHIPTPSDLRHGYTSHSTYSSNKSRSDLSSISQMCHASNSTPPSRCSSVQNREMTDVKTQQNVQATQQNTHATHQKPVVGNKSNYYDFLKDLTETINAGSSSVGKYHSMALNKDVKVTPVQGLPTTFAAKRTDVVIPQCAKQLIQQKKTDNAPNTFSRLSYMHKNKQIENKLASDALTVELNKNIMDHKVTKAKCIKDELTISRTSTKNCVAQDQGHTVSSTEHSSTKLQKSCPLLTSMLDSPGKSMGKCQTVSNVVTSSQSLSETQADREHADLLLLLRHQPILKPNPNSIVKLTNDLTTSQSSGNTQTKVDTQVPIAKHNLIGTKIKNITTVLNIPPVKKESASEDNTPQDWQSVMADILAHKTEPLGLNALDLVLKKDYKRHSLSNSRSHTNHKPRTSGQSSLPSKSDSKKREHYTSKSSSTRKPSSEKHSEAPKRHKQPEFIKKMATPEMHEKFEHNNHLSSSSSKQNVLSTPGIPNSAYDMLGDLMDDDLRQELGELSSDEDSYTTSNVPLTKGKSSNIPKTSTNTCKVSNVGKEDPRIIDPKITLCKNEANSNIVHPKHRPSSVTGYPNVIMNNSSHPDATILTESRTTSVCSNIERQATTTVITNQIVQPTAYMTNHAILAPNHLIHNIEPTNVIITSVPVPAQPVVVIRQDLVYDPYPTIRIHESQVSAGLCSVNQSVYAVNRTPNIAEYQTTQFAAPVINPVIIGNAMTTTNVQDAVAMTDPHETPDSINKNLANKTNRDQNSVDLGIANRLSEDNYNAQESTNLDFNMNKNCERKVLSQMQEKHPNENVDIVSHIRSLSHDDDSLKTEPDEERIKQKRQFLMNRKTSHSDYLPPIALTYTPLNKGNLGKFSQKESPKNGIVKHNGTIFVPNGAEKYVSTDSISAKSPKSEANNENKKSADKASTKENKKSCRRICLRSSNKLENIILPVKRPRISFPRNKNKLKVVKKGKEILTNLESENKDNLRNPTRISSRILNKKKFNQSDANPISPNTQQQNVKNRELISKPPSPDPLKQNNVENFELIDFEQELSGSKILKTSIITEKASKHAMDYDDMSNDAKVDNYEYSDTIAEEQNEDGVKETEVEPESNTHNGRLGPSVIIKEEVEVEPKSNKRTNNSSAPILVVNEVKVEPSSTNRPNNLAPIVNGKKGESKLNKFSNKNLEPTVVIERLKPELGDQLVKSLSVKKTEGVLKATPAEDKNPITLTDKGITTDCVAPQERYLASDKIKEKATSKNDNSTIVAVPQVLDKVKQTLADEQKVTETDTTTVQQKDNEQLSEPAKVSSVCNLNKKSHTLTNKTSLHNKEKATSETTPNKVMPKIINAMENNEPIKHEIPIDSEVSKTVQNKLAPIVVDDTDEENEIMESEPSPKTKDTQLSNNGTLKCNSLNEITNKGQQINKSKSILCHEKVSEAHSDHSNPNSNVVGKEKDTNQPVNCQPTNRSQHINDSVKTITRNNQPKGIEDPKSLTLSNKNTMSSKVVNTTNNDKQPIFNIKDIKIEELPLEKNRDSNTRFVRITLPTGKVFKASITGKIHGDFDSLFADPEMQSILAGGLSDRNRYTVNYTPIRANKENPNEIKTIMKIEKHVKGTSHEPIDTVNLISDDEDELETRTFVTEFGKYTATNIDLKTFTKHQKRFQQKCQVKLYEKRFEIDGTTIKLNSSDTENVPLLTRNKNKVACGVRTNTDMITGVDSKTNNCKINIRDSPSVYGNSCSQPTPQQETCTPPSRPTVNSSLLTRNRSKLVSESTAAANPTPEVNPNTKDSNGDIHSVNIDFGDKQLRTQGTNNSPRSLPATKSLLTRTQSKLVTNAINATNVIPEVDSKAKDDDTITHSNLLSPEKLMPIQEITTSSFPDKSSLLNKNQSNVVCDALTPSYVTPEVDSNSTKDKNADLLPVCLDSMKKATPANGTSTPFTLVKMPLPNSKQSDPASTRITTDKTIPEIDPIIIDSILPSPQEKNTEVLTPSKISVTSSLEQTNTLNTKNAVEVIEIDDSSNDSIENKTLETVNNENAGSGKEINALKGLLLKDFGVDATSIVSQRQNAETAVVDLKNALLHDLGIAPSENPVIDITNDEDVIPNKTQILTVVKECVVKITKCDHLIKKYELMNTMKKCYVKLEPVNTCFLKTASVMSSNNGPNNKKTDECEDNGEDFIKFYVDETSDCPQLSRCPSLSILNNWDDESSHKLAEEVELIEESESLACESEWMVTKFGYSTQEILRSSFTPTTENRRNNIEITDFNEVNENRNCMKTFKAPNLLMVTLKYLEENPDVICRMHEIRNISVITSSNKLKRKTDQGKDSTVANKILKLGTLALNAVNCCCKTVKPNSIPESRNMIISPGDVNVNLLQRNLGSSDFSSIPIDNLNRVDKYPKTHSNKFDCDITTTVEEIVAIMVNNIDIENNRLQKIETNQKIYENHKNFTSVYNGVVKDENVKQIVDFNSSDIETGKLDTNKIDQRESFHDYHHENSTPVTEDREASTRNALDCDVINTGKRRDVMQQDSTVLPNIKNHLETNETELKRHEHHDIVIPVSEHKHCSTYSSTGKDNMTLTNVGKVKDVIKNVNLTQDCKQVSSELDLNVHEYNQILVPDAKDQDASHSDHLYNHKTTVDKIDNPKETDRTSLSFHGTNACDINDIANKKRSNITLIEDTNSTVCANKTDVIRDSCIDSISNLSCSNTEAKNNEESKRYDNITVQTPEAPVNIKDRKVALKYLNVKTNQNDDIMRADKEIICNKTSTDAKRETEFDDIDVSESVEIDTKPHNDDFKSNTEYNSPELDCTDKNEPEYSHGPPSPSILSNNAQSITDVADIGQLDEILVDDLSNEGYEEVVECHEEDCTDIVKTSSELCLEPIPKNNPSSKSEVNHHNSVLKSPIFINTDQIFFNYHDYTKQPKKIESSTNDGVSRDCINHDTGHLNQATPTERDAVTVESSLNVDSKQKNCEDTAIQPEINSVSQKYCLKSKPECKYELIQEDDWLTVITTENEKADETNPRFVNTHDDLENAGVSKNLSININGFEYDDVYVFPLNESGSNSNTSNDSLGHELNCDIKSPNDTAKVDLHDINFSVIQPQTTYARKCLKRKMTMRDMKVPEKKYRKGNNIDCPKQKPKQKVISMNKSAYSREYKRLLEYCSSVKFSYSRPFHKECFEVEDLMSEWPINGPCGDAPGDVTGEHLFVNLRETDNFQPDPATQTLAEEISYKYEKKYATPEKSTYEAGETNFNMGFGEGSGRVIQILKKGGESNISAATLSDVKQSQPVLKSVDLDCNDLRTKEDDQIMKIRQYVNFIELRDKVRSFFKKSSVELKSDWMQHDDKDIADLKWRCNKFHDEDFPFNLCSLEYVKPLPTEAIVQVVQVGQLPVSAAAQNPVTCDPRVTQVSDASPSQCSVDNSPNDDSQSEIKTEYTELTTADLTLPLQEYAQQNQAMDLASHDSNLELTEQTISLEMEIKAEESPEIKEEMPDVKEERSNSSDTDLHTLTNAAPENLNYSFKNNTNKSDTNSVIYDSSEQNNSESFTQQRQQNGTSEKTDQIAHAMNAAGITTTPETVTNTRAHALVNILSQKIRHSSVNTTQTSTNTYTKPTSINAMSLQQALAQILPPPLNQTGSSENNQSQSTSVGPQVLHIVQGKNASGNQITLVDNSQQSVISTPNATQVLHIVQNKGATAGQTSNGTLTPQANSFSGLSLVDAGLQQGGNQLLHIVNTGNQKTASPGQLLKRVNLLTNLTNVQGSNEQKMVQFVCKSADGKAIQLNAPHQRSMVLRLQPIESPNVQTPTAKSVESQELSQSPTSSASNKESASQQEIKSRSIYEENYAKFIQNSSSKTPGLEKATSLPKFNQAFGKSVFQEGSQKQGEAVNNNSHLPAVNSNTENAECPATDNAINLEHIGQISSPPLLLRKQTAATSQSQSNIVQQIKQTIAPMNIQTMHGGVIYTRQIPVNIGGGQTINLITVPSTELINDDAPKTQTQTNQGEIEPSIIKIVPQTQNATNTESSQEESSNHAGSSSDNAQTPQPQPVLTQMRIKLPMLSKAPQMVPGARVVRPSFFQIQRNVIGGANQPVYQQLVLTAAPPLGQQTIRLPQAQVSRPIKVPSESQSSSSESQMSTSTLEQLREFDMVLEQVKERSTVQPNTNSNNSSFKIHTSSSDTTDGNGSSNCSTESTPQVLYSISNNQSLNVAYVNRKTTVTTPTTSTFVRSPDSTGIADSPTSSTHVQIPHTVTTDSSPTEMSSQSKPAKVGSKAKSRPKSTSNPPNTLKLNSVPPKTSSQKPLEDEQTTQRILYILAEYKEQVENSPDKDKPAPRRRSNPPSNPGSSKRKKSSSSRRSGTRDMSPIHGEDTCRTMGSEDSSCGTSQGDCNESCLDSHSPQDSPRKVARKITFDQDLTVTQPRPQPQRNVIVADGQTITVARGTTGKPATAVLMPANYILPVSMVKGGQQIAIVTNRGPKLLTVGGEGGATNALLLQRLIGPAGLKPVLARPGVRHVRLPTAALHNLQAFNLATATTVQPPDSTASPTPGPTPPELVDTRATSSPWTDRDDVKPERGSSPEGSEPWNLPSSADAHDYSYEETVRTDNMDRTVLVVQKKDGSQRQHRLSHVSAAALRHKYAILEHELRLQKSLSEECEDLGVDSPSASELFPEAELLFAASPAHEHNQDPHHSHTPQPIQSSIPQPDIDDQIATDHLIPREIDVSLGLGDVGIVAVSEDGMQATIALDQEEFARSHPNTTFHSEPTEGEVQPFTITGLKGRHITSTIFHSNNAPATVLMAAPQATVISQAPDHGVKYEIENMINSMPSSHNNDINLSSVLVKDDGLTRFDSILTDTRELHLTNTASAIVHSSGNATQVIRRVCYEDDKRERDNRFLIDEPDNLIAGDDAKMIAEDSSRDATLESMADVDDDRSSPERHAELFWESNSASERSESRRPLDFSSDSDKCCKSPSFDETNSTDSSGVGTHMRLDSVIKEARGRERSGSADGSSADDTHPPLRTYPPKRMYHPLEGEVERSLSGKTRAGERSPDSLEVRRRASGRGVVKRGCHCCNGSPAPPRPKKPRQRKPTLDFNTNN